jgi:hypothetical protein
VPWSFSRQPPDPGIQVLSRHGKMETHGPVV